MNHPIELEHLSRSYCEVPAVDDVSFRLEENQILGLLGRNGAGKTTLLRLIAGHEIPSKGTVHVLGENPFENEPVLQQMFLVRESQPYPDIRVSDVLASAQLLQPGWDDAYAHALVEDFRLPLRRRVRKLSRGMRSALGIVLGLASRAPLTLFDEPYLGLDAPSRQLFYDRFLADYAEHPRTVVLSTHLIDEVGNLLERVLVIDHGRVVIDSDADTLRGSAFTVQGPRDQVARLAAGRRVVHSQALGSLTSAVVLGQVGDEDRMRAADLKLTLTAVPLQQLVALATETNADADAWIARATTTMPEGARR